MLRQARTLYLALALVAINVAACQIAPTAEPVTVRIENSINQGEATATSAKNLAAALVRGDTITNAEAERVGRTADGVVNNLLQARYALDARNYDIAQGWVASAAPMVGELVDFQRKYTAGARP